MESAGGQGTEVRNQVVSSTSCKTPGLSEHVLYLDGITLAACLPFVPDYVESAPPDEFVQSAEAVKWTPFEHLQVYVIPYGVTPPTAILPTASAGIASVYRHKLREYSLVQGHEFVAEPIVQLFDQEVAGSASIIPEKDRSARLNANFEVEWVVEAGNRVWIVRTSAENVEISNMHDYTALFTQIERLSLKSDDLNQPSTSLAAIQSQPYHSGRVQNGDAIQQFSPSGDLPFPGWWNGDCNVNNHPGSYPLGGSYRGVKACGPLRTSREVNFGEGVHQLEWQCAEMSKRYLYLNYGTPPYQAHGYQVVSNYPGDQLDKISNGTASRAPGPGDVLSYDGPDGGHTSIVSSANVDGNGNGTIWIVEQNYSQNGTRSHQVRNWRVEADMVVTGWLQPKQGGPQAELWSAAGWDGSKVWNGGTGFSNGPNGNSFSLRLPAGWSARTWRGDDRGGGDPRCWSESVRDLTDFGWQNAIQSIEVWNHNVCETSDGQAELWSLAGWSGSRVWNGGTGFSNGPNGNSFSLRLPAGWSARTWRGDDRGGGDPRCWSESVRDLTDFGWQNAIQSIEILSSNVCSTECNPNADQIALFVDSDFRGQCVVKGIGDYPNPGAIGLPNDAISSLKVGSNVKARLCRDDNFGTCEDFTGDDSDLGNNGIGNDQTSSVKVERRASPPGAPHDPNPANDASLSFRTSLDVSVQGEGSSFRIHVWGNGYDRWRDWDPSRSLHLEGLTNQTYSWQAQAQNSTGASPWSVIWTFTIESANRPPNAPTSLSPANGATVNAMPQLCWQNNGDPDGDPVQFWVDLWGAASQQSGWITGNCWQPTASAEGTYFWHTQAKDNHDASSGYSPDWQFTLARPSTNTPVPTRTWTPRPNTPTFTPRPATNTPVPTRTWTPRPNTPTPTPTRRQPTATYTPVQHSWILTVEAEQPTEQQGMAIVNNDNSASQCAYVQTIKEWSADYVRYAIAVPETGLYYFWARAMGHAWNRNSFFVSVDGGIEVTFEITPMGGENGVWTWDWQRFGLSTIPPRYLLQAGSHDVVISSREADARLDKILIVNQPQFVPGLSDVTPCDTRTPTPTPTLTPTSLANLQPRTPTNLSPANNSTQTQMPQICWRNNGDPDGDNVSFWVDLMGADYEQSGWITSNCWRPSVQAEGTYSWHVQAIDEHGLRSPYSGDWNFTYRRATPTITITPTQPGGTILTAVATGPHSIGLAWTPFLANTQGYAIMRTFAGLPWQIIATVGGSSTSYEDSGSLGCGVEAFYIVQAFAASNQTQNSNYSFATTRGCWPNADARTVAPASVTAQYQYPNSIRINWQDRTSDETRFKIMRTTWGNMWYQAGVVSNNVTAFVDTEVGCGYEFYYMIRAERPSDGSVTEWAYASASAPACTGGPRLDNPSPLTLGQATRNSLRLQWRNTNQGQTSYEIQRAVYGSGWQQFNVPGGAITSYTDTGLSCDTRYYYRVRSARSTDGAFSEWSNFAQQSTAACTGATSVDNDRSASQSTPEPPTDLPPPESLAAPDILLIAPSRTSE